MVSRIQRKLITLFCVVFTLSSFAVNPDGILVSYSFDDGNIDSGPDTFSVFQNSKGRVSLTSFLSKSGYQSVEITDIANDNDFPELQGYFPVQKDGILYFHFSFLIINPEEEFNIALAGPKWFSLKKHGISFWLSNKNGYLVHYSDSIPKKLFELQASYWYDIDLTYYIDEGIYDLRIVEEGTEEALVDIYSVKNAPNQPGSEIDKFSFIGDLSPDVSNVIYYVDDVIIGVDKEIVQEQFIAPGRRKLFIDIWEDYRIKSHGKLVCLPINSINDFNIPDSLKQDFNNHGGYEFLTAVLNKKFYSLANLNRYDSSIKDYLAGIYNWHQGCEALEAGEAGKALTFFQNAQTDISDSRIIELSEIMAHAAQNSWDEVDFRLNFAYSDWLYDTRYDIALGMIYFHKKDIQSLQLQFSDIDTEYNFSNEEITYLKGFLNNALKHQAHQKFKHTHKSELAQALVPYVIAEQKYSVHIWNKDYDKAANLANTVLQHLESNELPISSWIERLGDIAFLSHQYQTAIDYYETTLETNPNRSSAISKLSDIYYSLGDLEKEKEYRQMV